MLPNGSLVGIVRLFGRDQVRLNQEGQPAGRIRSEAVGRLGRRHELLLSRGCDADRSKLVLNLTRGTSLVPQQENALKTGLKRSQKFLPGMDKVGP